MSVVLYCTGLKEAATQLKKTMGWKLEDSDIEDALSISWYTFYRWRTEEEPRRVGTPALTAFRKYYKLQMGKTPRVRTFKTKQQALTHMKRRKKEDK